VQNLAELRQLTRGALAEMRTLLLEMRPESLERADINRSSPSWPKRLSAASGFH